LIITYRRLGLDNGMDTLVHLDNNLRIALEQMDDKLFEPTPSVKPEKLKAKDKRRTRKPKGSHKKKSRR
jgi:hypothetical protein